MDCLDCLYEIDGYFQCETAGRPDRFSVALHHGGIFSNQCYIEGRLNYVDECSVLQFELVDLSSMMLKLGYDRKTICEFYYCHPANSDACIGTEVGHPLRPLIDEEHLTEFLSLATKNQRLVHIYAFEITVVEAVARQKLDQDEYLKEFYNPKSKIVIEEIKEPPLVVPKQKPGKKAKVNQEIPLLGWHEHDIEFEEFLEDSLVKAREKWSKEESKKEEVVKNLFEEFNAHEANVVQAEVAQPIVDVPSTITNVEKDKDLSETVVEASVDQSVEVSSAQPDVEEPPQVEEAQPAQVEAQVEAEAEMATEEDVYRPNLDPSATDVEPTAPDAIGDEPTALEAEKTQPDAVVDEPTTLEPDVEKGSVDPSETGVEKGTVDQSETNVEKGSVDEILSLIFIVLLELILIFVLGVLSLIFIVYLGT